MKTADLTGAILDYWVARAEGWVWVRNVAERSGDGYRTQGAPKQWPLGARCLVEPHRAKDLHAENRNWDGWVISDGTEPIAPAWNRDLPAYSTGWRHGGPIIEREKIMPDPMTRHREDTNWQAQIWMPYACHTGPTPLIAAMRAYVASRFGEEVADEVTP